jgi:NAD(P)H dehydrogenase (quinone)
MNRSRAPSSGSNTPSPASSLAAPPKVAANVYMEMHRISLLGDLALHLLCSSFPDEPIGAIADFFRVLSENEKSHLQVVDPPRPPYEVPPMLRAYLQRHRIAFLVEEWLGELCRVQPENPLVFSSAYFQRMFISRIRKGVPLPRQSPPPPMPMPSDTRVTIASTLGAESSSSEVAQITKPDGNSGALAGHASRPPSAVSERSSLSPLQSRDELTSSPVPPGEAGRSLSPLTPRGSPLRAPGSSARRTRLLILVYSHHGHGEVLGFAAMDGIMRNPQVDGSMYRFPETISQVNLEKMGVRKRYPDDPGFIPDFEDISTLPSYDGFIFIFPTRYGGAPGAVQNFLDLTEGLWSQRLLVDRVAGVMVSSATQHGGQERTIRAFQNSLLHHGMILVGANPREVAAIGIGAVSGCSPYGASTISGSDGSRMPSEEELRIAGSHAARVASFAVALRRHSRE